MKVKDRINFFSQIICWLLIWIKGSDGLQVGQLTHAGALLSRVSFDNNITMVNEYILIPLVLDESILKTCLDEYIMNIDQMRAKIMPRNEIIESIRKPANNKREIITSFLKNYKRK